VETPLPLRIELGALPVRGKESMVQQIFEPLGYEVQTSAMPLDNQFPEWGNSPYQHVVLKGTLPLHLALKHLYVLLAVFDKQKHYYISDDEVGKLLAKGEPWLSSHPMRDVITRRYLRQSGGLVRTALDNMSIQHPEDFKPQIDPESPADSAAEPTNSTTHGEHSGNSPQATSLNTLRHMAIVDAVIQSGAKSALDLGCGEGKLLRRFADEKQLTRIVGIDVDVQTLRIAARRLRLESRQGFGSEPVEWESLPNDHGNPNVGEGLADTPASRIHLLQGSLMYSDSRMKSFDAAVMCEVIEHLDPPRLSAMEYVVFADANPPRVIVTTPNAEYNAVWENLPAGTMRHRDHRFEWTRNQFQNWAERVAEKYGYTVNYQGIGSEHEEHGHPTQMATFQKST
ncbi:MAG: methyltransferase, partial [Planctomycetota bacterium]